METTSRSFTIPNLTIVPLDHRINQVLGTADPGLQVTVDVSSIYQDLGYGQRHVFSDASGNWVADFNVAGPGPYEGDVVDFLPGQAATAYIQMTTVDYLYFNAYAPAGKNSCASRSESRARPSMDDRLGSNADRG